MMEWGLPQQSRRLQAWLSENKTLVLSLGGSAVVGAVLVGILSDDSKVLGFNVTGFDQASALLFLAAFGQIVLAAAVWDQIRSARLTADATDAAAAAANRSAESAGAAVALAVADQQRSALFEEARALTDFLAQAYTACERYRSAAPEFRIARGYQGERRRGALRQLSAVFEPIESAAQDALLARYQVLVYSGRASPADNAADGLASALIDRKNAAHRLLQDGALAKDADLVLLQDTTRPLLDECVRVANEIRTTAHLIG